MENYSYAQAYTNFRLFVMAHAIQPDYWYDETNQFARQLAEEFGTTTDVAAAVIAVLSPNISWPTNKEAARNVMSAWQAGKKAADVTVAGFAKNKRKAFDILENGVNVGVNISGPKVTAFYTNILEPRRKDRVTIDVWMIRLALADYTIHIKQSGLTGKRYQAIASALIDLASEMGVPPAALQAGMWVKVRQLAKRG